MAEVEASSKNLRRLSEGIIQFQMMRLESLSPRIRFHLKAQPNRSVFTFCLHGNDENGPRKRNDLKTQSKVDRVENATIPYPCKQDENATFRKRCNSNNKNQ